MNAFKTDGWNPRFVHYCTSLGLKPEELNSTTRPGWAVGFTEWIQKKIGEFRQVNPKAFKGFYQTTLVDHKAFDEWLDQGEKAA